MQNRNIKLKSKLTTQYLSSYIYRFFRTNMFSGNYYYVITKISLINNKSITLGNKELLKINNKGEIKTYVDHVIESFLNLKDTFHPKAGDILYIYYLETTKDQYNKYKKSLEFSTDLDINLDDNINPNYYNSKLSNLSLGRRFYSTLYNFSLGRRCYSTSITNKIKNLTVGNWYDYEFEISSKLLLTNHIEFALRDFWLNIVERIEDIQYILVQFKIRTDESLIRSISYVETINVSDLEKLIPIFQEYWNIQSEDYHDFNVDSIIFAYKILVKEGSIGQSNLNRHKKVDMVNIKPFKFSGYNLPTTMDITKWSGNVQFNNDFTSAIVYINQSVREYHVQLFDNYQIVKVVVNNHTMLEFKDTVNNINDLSYFTRKIKNKLYIFENGELVIKQIERKANFLTKLDKDPSTSNKFITMDLETRNINGILEPYCISIYLEESNGLERAISYYLRDGEDSDSMLKFAINSLLLPRYDGYIIYLHNFSNFDGIFLIRILSELTSDIRPIIKDGKIINISLNFGSKYKKYTIYFRDSYLLLPASLNKLANSFNIDFKKGIFPYKFVNNPEIKLNYKGKIPDITYFDGISKTQYKEYCSKRLIWDLEYETKYYCELDCKVLYLVIKTFNKHIFDLFNLDINKYPTLPSLAMAIYRSNFLENNFKIPLIDGIIFSELRKGYTGGMVDVYKPTNDPETKVYSYDVNSLYPFAMHDYSMPIGKPNYFEGDIFKVNPNAFGIFEAEITTPTNLNYPILQTKVKINNSYKTITPVGNWKGWYFSEEILNAMKFGYKIKVHRGYLFDKGYIFNNYVNSIFELKANSQPDTPNYIIAKLLLNSLYGKFGIDPNLDKHVIINSNKSQKYHNKYVVTNVINLGNNKELISYFNNSAKPDNHKTTYKNSSLPIALAITSHARIHMSLLKKAALDLGLTIYYMDTDCVALSGEFDPKYVGKELGKLKLEHIFNEVIYLAPKVYAGKAESYEYSKVKGLKNQISFDDLKPLLNKNESANFVQEKMYKNIGEGNIEVRREVYTLMITENKRKLIFNENNIFTDTKPYILNNGNIIE